jgi:hypothetical protein
MNNPLKPNIAKAPEAPAAPEVVSYTSHPIENFAVGNYKFEKGLLTLAADDAEAFDKLLATLPPQEANRVKKLDVQAAELLVKQLLENQRAAATQVTDSSTGERATPVVGTGKLEDSNPPAGE